jgi:diguanylate cyclase (GGDEF)-like protein
MLLASATPEELLHRMTDELKRLVPYDALTVYQADEVRRMLVPVHSADLYAEEILNAPLAFGHGLTGWVFEHRRAENLPAAHRDPRIQIVPGTDNEPEALAVVPLIVRGAPIGTLNVYRLGEDVEFSGWEFELICRFADLAALAMDNTRIRERLVKEAQTDWLTGLGNHRLFHERLRAEAERAHRYKRPMSLIVFDLDDFKLLNDVHGHQDGDMVLRRVAAAACEGLRGSDLACRVGGEEFAILLPEAGKRAAKAVADRLCARVRRLPGPRPVTVSCGVAALPVDAGNPTELLAAADAALYAAKERGKDRAARYSAAVRSRRARRVDASGNVTEMESLTQIRLLGSLASKLNRLNDVERIGRTIVDELRTMIDYHNARVYLLADDGVTLEPIAFGGTLSEYAGETFDVLRTRMGDGITGTAALSGRTLNIGDAQSCPFAETVEGTVEIDESMLVVPLRYERRTTGAIVLSKLGLNQFSMLSVRLLEVLAAQAAVALQNARLLAAERRTANVSRALLEIATLSAREPSPRTIARLLTKSACELTGAAGSVVVDPRATRPGDRILAAHGAAGSDSIALAAAHSVTETPAGVVLLRTDRLPAVSADAPPGAAVTAIAAVHSAVLVVAGEAFSQEAVETIQAIAGHGALALQNADLLRERRPA